MERFGSPGSVAKGSFIQGLARGVAFGGWQFGTQVGYTIYNISFASAVYPHHTGMISRFIDDFPPTSGTGTVYR